MYKCPKCNDIVYNAEDGFGNKMDNIFHCYHCNENFSIKEAKVYTIGDYIRDLSNKELTETLFVQKIENNNCPDEFLSLITDKKYNSFIEAVEDTIKSLESAYE